MHRIPLYILALVGVLLIGYTAFLSAILTDHGVVAENVPATDLRLAATSFHLGSSWVKVGNDTAALAGLLDDGDEFGVSLEAIGDLDGDGVQEFAISAWEDDDGGANFGALYIISITNSGAVTLKQKISQSEGGFTGPLGTLDNFSTAIAALGDLDGDTVPDIAVGARADDDGGTNRGAVYILFLNADGSVKAEQKISSTTGGFGGTLDDTDLFGTALAALPDVNGDDIPDLAVAAQQDDDGGSNYGAIWILYLDTDGTVIGESKISALSGGFDGVLAAGDALGRDLANIGDLDGDGMADLVAGTLFDDGGADRGGAFVIFLNTDGTVKATQRISDTAGGFLGGLSDTDGFGNGITGVSDADDDGVIDMIIGSWQDDALGSNAGASYLLFMNTNGTVKDFLKIGPGTSGLASSLESEDRFGFRATSFNFNGLGGKDVLIGAYQDDAGGADRGAFYIGYLSLTFSEASPAIYPQFLSLSIEESPACVTSPTVTLELRAREAVEVLIANDPLFQTGEWEPMMGEFMRRVWTLTPDDGEKTVYARFRSSSGNQSQDLSVNVTLDQAGNCGVIEEVEETPVETPPEESEEDAVDESLPGTLPPPTEPLPELLTLQYGDVIKIPTVKTVFFIDEELNRRPFEEPFTYFTWEDSYNVIKVVDPSVLIQFPLESFMPPKAGSVLIKTPDLNDVYYVDMANGRTYEVQRRLVPNEEIAIALFGENWSDYVHDVRKEILDQLPLGDALTADSALVEGTEMKTRAKIYALASIYQKPLLRSPFTEELSEPSSITSRPLGRRFIEFIAGILLR